MGKTDVLPKIAVRKQRAVDTGTMSKQEAEAWAGEVDARAGFLHHSLARGFERRAWVGLGYPSWDAMIEQRFDLSRRRVNQYLGQIRVAEALAEAGNRSLPAGMKPAEVLSTEAGNVSYPDHHRETFPTPTITAGQSPDSGPASSSGVAISARDAAAVGPDLDAAAETVARKVSHGVDPVRAVRDVVDAARSRRKPKVMAGSEQLAFAFDEAENVLVMATEPTPENFQLLREALRSLIDAARQSAPARPEPPATPSLGLACSVPGCTETTVVRSRGRLCPAHG